MKLTHLLVAAVLLAMLPAVASADRGRYYDRGDRYRHSDRSRFNVSFGFGSSGYRDYSYVDFGYSRGYSYRPRYYAPPPVVYRPAYVYRPAPRVYYAPPPRVYYYDTCAPRPYYRESRYYYGW